MTEAVAGSSALSTRGEAPELRTPTEPPRRRRLPSAGFVALCAVYASVAAFFVWGLSTPDLDRIWTLHHELKAGRIGAPRAHDREVLARSMARHGELARALLPEGEIGLISSHSEGWIAMPEATIVRTSTATERWLELEVATPRDRLPFTVEVSGQGWSKRVEIKRHGIRAIELPVLRAGAELVIVKIKGRELRDDPSVLGVRISFSKQAPIDEPRS